MLGVLANSAGVLFGGAVGLALRGRINQKYTSALMAALALVSPVSYTHLTLPTN